MRAATEDPPNRDLPNRARMENREVHPAPVAASKAVRREDLAPAAGRQENHPLESRQRAAGLPEARGAAEEHGRRARRWGGS